jgi:hypothetical protein
MFILHIRFHALLHGAADQVHNGAPPLWLRLACIASMLDITSLAGSLFVKLR